MAVNARSTLAVNPENSALSLLSAAAFTIRHSSNAPASLHWAQPLEAARLFACAVDDIPATPSHLGHRLLLDAQRARKKAIAALTWNGAQYRTDYALDIGDGRSIWVEERGQRIQGDGNIPHVIQAVLHNIDASKSAMKAAAFRAARDPLTGLWNRTRMAEEAGQLIGLASRNFLNPALAGIQLTNLTDINTNFGFAAGDRLLAMAADRLKTLVQAPDTAARLSGDTFALGFCQAERDDLRAICGDITKALSQSPYQTPNGELTAHFVAVAAVRLSAEDGPRTPEEAFSQLELALSHSLHAGQGFTYYHADMAAGQPAPSRPATTEADIIAALNDRRISLAYQPIIDASTRETHHYECLLRLKKDSGEIVSAGAFIMAAEDLGLVHLLDRRALELARETLLHSRDIHLALNVSAATVKDPKIAADYLDALKALGVMTRRVTLELTETVALEDPSKAAEFASAARGMGCEFAIDDFGSGYTSFRNLMAIEADSIKIDGTFIQDLSITPYKQTFIRMMVDLAQTFGVTTVAEMVSTKEDADLLKRLGVDYLQGFMFGVPSPMPMIQRQAS